MPIGERNLQDLLPLSLESTPCVSIRRENKVWVAASMLIHYLESFTDSLVVTDDESKPLGIVGGKEVLENILKNPSSAFFDDTVVEDIMDKNVDIISKEITLKDLLQRWTQTRRAFSILPNRFKGYSAISARKLLEIGANCETEMTVSELPKKKITTFTYNDTLKDIINSMFENKTRKLVFKNTSSFISDRIIIEYVVRELNYLRQIDYFLDLKFEEPFRLAEAKTITENMKIPEISKIMFGMLHPLAIYHDQVISPWDLCVALLYDKIEFSVLCNNFKQVIK
ncbi:MAG: CBS domain-containing protein [Nitrosopumilaceae archaeon]|nr:CBS domain-containing protein [Nitrosopumilaceae archaeon]